MPFVEVKNVKENQYLVPLSDDDDFDVKYFVIVESHLRNDYILALLEDQVFSEGILKKLIMNSDYIKKDSKKLISLPPKIEKISELGFFELLGIFKGSEIKKFCSFCKGKRVIENHGEKIKVDAESPFYLQDIYPDSTDENYSEILSEGQFIYNYEKSDIYIPIEILYLKTPSVVRIIHKRKWSFNISVKGLVKINEFRLTNGMYRIELDRFDRNAPYNEYLAHKTVIKEYAEDKTGELIAKFDQYVKGK